MSQSASEMVDLYIQAEKDVLEGKSTKVNGREYTMENLADIREGRRSWERRLVSEKRAAQGVAGAGHALATFAE